jgi:mRNA interferase RelE/StbE
VGKFKIEFSKNAAKDYKKLPKDYKVLIDLVLTKLSEGQQLDIKPILGEKDCYRIRVGKYRILFTIIENTILVTKIGARGDVYK